MIINFEKFGEISQERGFDIEHINFDQFLDKRSGYPLRIDYKKLNMLFKYIKGKFVSFLYYSDIHNIKIANGIVEDISLSFSKNIQIKLENEDKYFELIDNDLSINLTNSEINNFNL